MMSFEDISSPGVVLIRNDDYEIQTSSSVPDDLKDGIVILCYSHDIASRYRLIWVKARDKITGEIYSCEFLRNLALNACYEIAPLTSHLFNIYDRSGKLIMPLGKQVNSATGGRGATIFLLRMTWKPRDFNELNKADPAALRYLYHQCHDDFVYGDTIERVSSSQKTYESLLGLVIFDMVAFALNSRPKIELQALKKNYKANQFMNRKVLTDLEPSQFMWLYQIFNKFRINRICEKNLKKHYEDFSGCDADGAEGGAVLVMISYINAIIEKVVGYFVVVGKLRDENRKVVINHPHSQVYIQCVDGSKEELFEISKLQKHLGISVERVGDEIDAMFWRLVIYITDFDHGWKQIKLDFASSEEADHIAAALLSLYQSTVLYPCADLTDVERLIPPSIMMLKNCSYHGPLSDNNATRLIHNYSGRPGSYVMRQSPCKWQLFYLDIWRHLPEQPSSADPPQSTVTTPTELIKCSVLLTDKLFRIVECENLKRNLNTNFQEECFPSMHGTESVTAFLKSKDWIKEIISPSVEYRAGIHVGFESRAEPRSQAGNSTCVQAHLISSSELKLSDSKSIGEGTCTEVFKTTWRQKTVAVKMVKKHKEQQTKERQLQINTSRLLQLKNSSLVEIYGFSVDSSSFYVLMEYCPHHAFSRFLVRERVKNKLQKKHLISAQRQILKGLEFLHENGRYHGNLRCGNVLVSEFSERCLVVKLADPGLTEFDKENATRSNSRSRFDLRLYADTLKEMYSAWTTQSSNNPIILEDGFGPRPVHCQEEIFDVMKKCWDQMNFPNLKATDVLKDLTVFEQGFAGGELLLFTPGPLILTNEDSGGNSCTMDSMIIERSLVEFKESKDSTLGKGHYGQVFRGKYRQRACAVKKLLASCSDNIEQSNMEAEFKIMSELDHESIVKIYGRCLPVRDESQCEPYLLVMEFMEGGSLLSHLQTEKKSAENSVTFVSWALQTAQGLEYLHGKSIVHRDLACRNILLSADFKCVKISDFGLARLLKESDYYKCNHKELPMYWVAPESFPTLPNAQCTMASDVWSYGVVLWEIVNYGAKPNSVELYKNMQYQQLYSIFSNTSSRLPMPLDCPSVISHLATQCWKFLPSERPRTSDIVAQLQE